jgi:hypothetical protein
MTLKTLAAALAAVAFCAAAARPAFSDGMVSPEAEAAEENAGAGASLGNASLSAKLVDEKANAQKAAAIIEVKVKGVTEPRLQYKVDDGPAMETSDMRVRFRGLKPGAHQIQVLLQGQDGAALGPSEMLSVTVP